ncbi:hypothetical protein KBC80_03310 [Candidatus Woesebacteria bacterium]|nr:hypothetical protein [Candidatus Woesebacteria bacterium]
MDDLVKALVSRIELSKLSDKEKEAIYQEISTSLRSVVWPVVIKYAPKDSLNDLAQHPSKISVETFSDLVEKSIHDGQALLEIEKLMTSMVAKFNDILTQEGVPQIERSDDMEAKLKALVERIEKSKLSEEDRAELYATISEGLQATVWPILLKYMPKDQLEALAADKSKVTVESYGKLIEDTIKDGEALKEIDGLMNDVLSEVDKALQEEGV